MTIWILVVVLLASLAGLGYRQGAIRVAISLVGILMAMLLALPLSPLVKPILPILGVKSLVLQWLLPPFIVFVLINSAFKGMALPVHRKVDVYFKYKAGDLRLALFERLNARLGFCLGMFNGAVYLSLVVLPIYILGYWTVPLTSSEESPWTVRLFNRVALDLQGSGLARVAKSLDPMPDDYYDAADLAALIYQNPRADARLVRYPTLFALGTRPEFQQLGSDLAFTELRAGQKPFRELVNHPSVDTILKNTELLTLIWSTVQPDLADLTGYMRTGKSAKYDPQKLLGCWSFDFSASFVEYRRTNPKLSALVLRERRKFLAGLFLNTEMTIGTDGFVILGGLPRFRPAQPGELAQPPEARTLTGRWRGSGGSYDLQFEEAGTRLDFEATVSGDRLTVTGDGVPLNVTMVFERDV